MAQEAQTRVQRAFHDLLRDLDQTCLRKMQGDMHRCAATCCDQRDTSLEATQDCVNKCSKHVNSAQSYVEREMTSFQGRLERCVLQCQDNMRDKIGANTSDTQISSLTKDFETCVVKCVDTHIELIPNLSKKMKDIIKKGAYDKDIV